MRSLLHSRGNASFPESVLSLEALFDNTGSIASRLRLPLEATQLAVHEIRQPAFIGHILRRMRRRNSANSVEAGYRRHGLQNASCQRINAFTAATLTQVGQRLAILTTIT